MEKDHIRKLIEEVHVIELSMRENQEVLLDDRVE